MDVNEVTLQDDTVGLFSAESKPIKFLTLDEEEKELILYKEYAQLPLNEIVFKLGRGK